MKIMRYILPAVLVLAVSANGQVQDQDKLGDRTGPTEERVNRQGPQGPGDGTRPELPEELKEQLRLVKQNREALLEELKAVLEGLGETTREERREAVEAWREDHADRIQEQRELAQQVREQIREWVHANRPERPEPPQDDGDDGVLTDEDAAQNMARIKERRQEMIQAREELKEQLENAATEEERQQILAQHRTERMEQIQQRKDEFEARKGELDREGSLASLREQLQENADMLRTRARIQDREEARLAAMDQLRQTLRDGDRPDRPERPEQPDRPDRPDRPERLERPDGAGGDAYERRQQLRDQQAP